MAQVSKIRFSRIGRFQLLGTVASGVFLASVLMGPQALAQNAEVLSAAVGKPLQAASTALSHKSYAKAMASVAAADAIKGKTDYEAYVVNQMRAAVAAASGDQPAAAHAYQALIASPRSSTAEKHQMMMALATNAYSQKNYPQAVIYIRQYLKAAGPNAQMQTLLVQSYYLQNDFANAAKTQLSMVEADIRAGRKPAENALQFLATCYAQTHQSEEETHAYVLLAKYYPKPEYWARLVHDLAVQQRMAVPLRFNLMRLRAVTGTLNSPTEWVDMAERAVQAGMPQLGLQLLDEGLHSGLIGRGSDAARMQKLRALMVSRAQESKSRSLTQRVQDAESDKTGQASETEGYNLILAGQVDDGRKLMEQGIAKMSDAKKAVAQLGYAMALRDAGQTRLASKAFDAVRGDQTAENLALLWGVLTPTANVHHH